MPSSLLCEDQFATALTALYPKVLRQAMHLVGNEPEARDIVQDAMERALRFRRHFHFGETPEPWLRTIVQHLFYDRRRYARRRPLLLDEDLLLQIADGTDTRDNLPWWQALDEDEVRRACVRLPPVFREVILMRLETDLSLDEMAARLGTSANAVAKRLFRGRRLLRVLFESDCQPIRPGVAMAMRAPRADGGRAAERPGAPTVARAA